MIGVKQRTVSEISKNFNTKLFASEYESGLTPEQIAKELGWDESRVTRHKQICELLHPKSWQLARAWLPKTTDLATDDDEGLGKQELPIVNWCESHFRALLKHLPCSNGDRGAMRAQIAVLKEALKRWDSDRKVTAKWEEGISDVNFHNIYTPDCAIGTVNRVLSQFSTAENWDTKQ